jgi:predicted phage-related endonuclease
MSEIDRHSAEYRRTHLGASQWPSACGMDPYVEPIDLYARYVGLAPWDDPDMPRAAIRLGHALEAGVAEYAAEELGLQTSLCPTLEHPEHVWLCATPDRLLSDGTLLQIKTTRLVTQGSYVEEWGEPGSDEVPPRVLAQVMGEMYVARAVARAQTQPLVMQSPPTTARIAALIAGRGVCLYRVDWDEDLAQLLWERVSRFWTCVVEKKPPQCDDSEAVARYLAARYPEHRSGVWLDADEGTTRVALEFRLADEQARRYEALRDVAKTILMSRIGDAEGVRGPWGKIAWRAVRGREALDMESFLAELRALYGTSEIDRLVKAHTARRAGHRRFVATWADKEKEETA